MKKFLIDEAILNAEKSLLGRTNHGAIVVYRGKIVGRGHNKWATENVNRVNRYSIHAEVDAINTALLKISKENLKQSTLIVVRYHKDGDKQGETSNSAPCKCCTNFIKKCGIPYTYYS